MPAIAHAAVVDCPTSDSRWYINFEGKLTEVRRFT